MANAWDIIGAARELLGVTKYRYWQDGDPIPMWRKDGWGEHPLPPFWYFEQNGIMGADLINYALARNGIGPNGGTGTFLKDGWLVRAGGFDPNSPGQAGAIAFRPYQDPVDNGSIALYLDEHQVIQSIPSDGVTDQYTDAQTYSWAPQWGMRYRFTYYAFLWGVSY
jgi:hypothetical protein